MPIALTARINVNPKSILQSRWAHDTAHQFLRHLMTAEFKAGILAQATRG